MNWPEIQHISVFNDKRGITHGFDLPLDHSTRAFIVKNDWYVARGFHRQKDMNRIIFVIEGNITDVLRSADGETREYKLSEGDMLYIPSEIYHGYYSEFPSSLLYITDKPYKQDDEENIADPHYFLTLANRGRLQGVVNPKMSIRDMGGKTDVSL